MGRVVDDLRELAQKAGDGKKQGTLSTSCIVFELKSRIRIEFTWALLE